MANYRKDKYYISQHNSGIPFDSIDGMSYYEYVELKLIVADELKQRAKEHQQQKAQMGSLPKPSMNTPRLPKFKK